MPPGSSPRGRPPPATSPSNRRWPTPRQARARAAARAARPPRSPPAPRARSPGRCARTCRWGAPRGLVWWWLESRARARRAGGGRGGARGAGGACSGARVREQLSPLLQLLRRRWRHGRWCGRRGGRRGGSGSGGGSGGSGSGGGGGGGGGGLGERRCLGCAEQLVKLERQLTDAGQLRVAPRVRCAARLWPCGVGTFGIGEGEDDVELGDVRRLLHHLADGALDEALAEVEHVLELVAVAAELGVVRRHLVHVGAAALEREARLLGDRVERAHARGVAGGVGLAHVVEERLGDWRHARQVAFGEVLAVPARGRKRLESAARGASQLSSAVAC